MSDHFFVPVDFAVPGGLMAEEFRLEPLGPQHNAADYAAWTASISHIQATPGFAGTGWPHEMSLAGNLRDLERHSYGESVDFAGFVSLSAKATYGDITSVTWHAASSGCSSPNSRLPWGNGYTVPNAPIVQANCFVRPSP
jgi:hypothetical protein